MSPATLYREGPDLDNLLADLDQQHPGRVRVVSIAHPREGGVLGFFAKQRVGVHYRLIDGSTTEIYDEPAPVGAAEAADGAPVRPPQFAEILAELAARRTSHAATGGDSMVDLAVASARGDGVELSGRIPEPEFIDDIPHDTPTAASPIPVSRAYAQIQARADAAAARLAADLAADPAAGFIPVSPRAVPPQRTVPRERGMGSSVQPLIQWSTQRRRTPGAVPTFQPMLAEVAEPQPVRWPNADQSVPEPMTTSDAPSDVAEPTSTIAPGPTAEPVRPAAALPTVRRTANLAWTIGAPTPAAATDAAPTGPPVQPVPTTPPAAPFAAALRGQLAALGIDPARVPDDVTHGFTAIDAAIATLPEAPMPPTGADQVLVVTGRSRDALLAADTLTAAGAIGETWYYGCPVRADQRTITSAEQVADVVARARQQATGPVLIVVATDGSCWPSRAREVIEAAAADARWAVVDATVKSADARAGLRRLGEVDALIVSSAEDSSSPATVWELGKPVALLDGRPATPAAWAVLLMGKLTDMGKTCSDARY